MYDRLNQAHVNTKPVNVANQNSHPSQVGHLLTPKARPARKAADPSDVGPESLTVRATTVSVVLKEILEQQGRPYGGINE